MADFNKPATTDTYANFLAFLNAKIQDLALGLDPANTTPTNVPTNALRWNSANNRFEKYNGTAWAVLSATFAVGALTATSTATATAFIPTGSTAPANGMYLPAANTLAFTSNSSERWRVDSSGNFVIGSTSPASSKFRVVAGDSVAIGLINGASYGVRFGSTVSVGANIDAVDITGTASYQPLYLGGSTLGLQTGGTTRVTVDSSGNVGIGGTPYVKLDVYGNAAFRGSSTRLRVYNTANGTDATLAMGADSGLAWLGAETNTAFYLVTNNLERMRIDASGNVGIGTSSPLGIFEVKASAPAVIVNGTTSASFRGLSIRSNGTEIASMLAEASGGENRITAGFSGFGGFQTFYTNGAERARIDSSGNLGVGGAPQTNIRTALWGVGTTSSTYSLITYTSNGFSTFSIRDDGLIQTGTRSLSPYNCTTASAANMYVGSDSILYRSTSSLKYKTNVQDATHGLTELLTLRPVTYEGKSEADTGKTFGGLIAEEVHEAGLSEFVQYADDGTPDALAYGQMVSLCIKAIQEQQAIIVQLQSDVAKLMH